MALIFTDGIDYSKGFNFQANQPLDLRTIVQRVSDLDNMQLKYNGIMVYVTGYYNDVNHDNEAGLYTYVLSANLEPDNNKLMSGNWHRIIAPGGAINSDLLPSYVDDIVEGTFSDCNLENGFYTQIRLYGINNDGSVNKNDVGDAISGVPGKIYIVDSSYDSSPNNGISNENEGTTTRAYRWTGSFFIEIISQHVSAITPDQINELFS